ncbi:MAG: proline/glycine/betaine transporter permease [Acidimicrobiia bacterium]|nr:proline/glycine/betaine transporter permease [Acidimicrobiia bacterium]
MMVLGQTSQLVDWDWIGRNIDQIADRTWQHLSLTAVSVGIGLVISLALAIVALRWRWSYTPITWVTGLLYTIPSLALFALLVPVVGLNATNAVIALTSYTLLIIIRNLVAGIDSVPDAVLEAADGMGYTRRARFWRMEVPLALPVIIAGLRIATVTTVGLVTVTAVLGLGGYGYFILRGLNTFFWTQILVGVVLSVALATVLDIGFLVMQRALSPWARRAR